MSYQQTVFANNEFYHIMNRGVEKRITFLDRRDYQRFLEILNYYRIQNPIRFSFRKRDNIFKKEVKDKSLLVEIACFCLMPNHFHLLVKQLEEGGITTFISKLSNSYTKYFNTRHKRVGPLFQGSFKAVRIENNEQLMHVSRYIHLNPLIDYLVKDLRTYSYSSYLEFLDQKIGFCQKESITTQFQQPSDYERFVLDQEDYARTIKNIERILMEVKT